MKVANGFFAEMAVFAGMFICEVALSTGSEVEKLVCVVRGVDKEGVEVESQDGEGWDFSDESSLSL